ncbi:hypothetical protein CB1_000746009 [Camelus ferus]|nr:hypothetical protein CB1_000746009 [Camelus ferus]
MFRQVGTWDVASDHPTKGGAARSLTVNGQVVTVQTYEASWWQAPVFQGQGLSAMLELGEFPRNLRCEFMAPRHVLSLASSRRAALRTYSQPPGKKGREAGTHPEERGEFTGDGRFGDLSGHPGAHDRPLLPPTCCSFSLGEGSEDPGHLDL